MVAIISMEILFYLMCYSGLVSVGKCVRDNYWRHLKVVI